MAKVTIAGIELDPADHKKNSKEHRAAVFAHLSGAEKEAANAELEEAISKEDKPASDSKIKLDKPVAPPAQ